LKLVYRYSIKFIIAITILSFFTPFLVYAEQSSGDMLINPITNKIYFLNKDNKTISIIDGNSNKILSSISLEGERPSIFNLDAVNSNIPIIGTIVGIITAMIGLITYRQSQGIKKMNLQKDIVFPLVDEFDNKSLEMDLAKDILEEIEIEPKSPDYAYGIYNVDRLKKVLMYHRKRKEPWDKGDGYVRGSFSKLLDFLSRLEYLKLIGLLKDEEIQYFWYYIDKIIKNEAVMDYIKEYKFPFYGNIDYRLDYR
jgi:hypothetical protein